MNKLEAYINELKNELNDKLESVFVYGAKAHEPVYDLKDNVDLIVIVQQLNAQDLKKVAKSTFKWSKQNPVPVFMSTEEWFASTDVYPMEYADIKENHHILFGENLIETIEVKREDLRLQCEQEIKNLLMRFRKDYILNSSRKKELEAMLIAGFKTSMAVFKTILRLKNITVPEKHSEILEQIAKLEIIDILLYKRLLCFKERKCKIENAQSSAEMFIDETDKLLAYTNKL